MFLAITTGGAQFIRLIYPKLEIWHLSLMVAIILTKLAVNFVGNFLCFFAPGNGILNTGISGFQKIIQRVAPHGCIDMQI